MEDNEFKSEMPQEDVETKSLLTLILDKIAELLSNIQSGFNNLTNHVGAKTIQINSDLGKPLNVQLREQYVALSDKEDYIFRKLFSTGNGINTVAGRSDNHRPLNPTKYVEIFGACEVLSFDFEILSDNFEYKMTIDNDIYYFSGTGEIFLPFMIGVAGSSAEFIAYYTDRRGGTYSENISTLSFSNLIPNVANKVTKKHILPPRIRCEKYFCFEIIRMVKPYEGAYSGYAFSVRI